MRWIHERVLGHYQYSRLWNTFFGRTYRVDCACGKTFWKKER